MAATRKDLLKRSIKVVVLLAVLLGSRTGGADRLKSIRLDVEVVTDLPMHVGGRVNIEGPYRSRFGTSVGVLPQGYVELINAVAGASPQYDGNTQSVVEQALKTSLVWRTHVGWRPWASLGLYFDIGYTFVTLGGGVSNEDLLLLMTGVKPPVQRPGDNRDYDVSSTLHMFDAEVGWQFVFFERLVVRGAVGLAATMAASTEINPTFTLTAIDRAFVESLTRSAERDLDESYISYVHAPLLTVGVGYRFF